MLSKWALLMQRVPLLENWYIENRLKCLNWTGSTKLKNRRLLQFSFFYWLESAGRSVGAAAACRICGVLTAPSLAPTETLSSKLKPDPRIRTKTVETTTEVTAWVLDQVCRSDSSFFLVSLFMASKWIFIVFVVTLYICREVSFFSRPPEA